MPENRPKFPYSVTKPYREGEVKDAPNPPEKKSWFKRTFENAEIPRIESRFGKGKNKSVDASRFLGGGLFG